MYCFDHEDTIAAISTAMGDSGIGIVRLTGCDALEIAQKIFKSRSGKMLRDMKSHTMVYGNIIDPMTESIIDEALAAVMLAPHTYTTQDVVELNSHGGGLVTKTVLQAALKAGARMALPGEFTKRAFLGGRIDLTQAEAVMDVIGARSEKGLRLSLNQLKGGLKQKIDELDFILVDLLSDMEANIDYPEYDIEELSKEKTLSVLNKVQDLSSRLLHTLKVNRIFHDGLSVAIIGAPNAGKSSLLNELLQTDKAIVTEIPGTTRDIVEDYLHIEGIPFKIIDTAGIRRTDDIVEKIGVERSIHAADSADLILFIYDSSREALVSDYEMIDYLKNKPIIFIHNKIDLPVHSNALNVQEALRVSMKTGFGLEMIRASMVQYALKDTVQGEENEMIATIRQISLIEKAVDFINSARSSVLDGLPLELVSIDIKEALSSLREITGKEIGTDIIDAIFSKFCLGK